MWSYDRRKLSYMYYNAINKNECRICRNVVLVYSVSLRRVTTSIVHRWCALTRQLYT